MADVENRGDWAGLGLWPRMTDANSVQSPQDNPVSILAPAGAVRVHLVMGDEGGSIVTVEEANPLVSLVSYTHIILPVREGDQVGVESNVWSFWFDMVSEP